MEENGARLNRDRLARAYLLTHSLAGRNEPSRRSQSQIRRRAGAVQEAVLRVLAAAEGPLRAREIHVAAEELAGNPLSWNTVKDCLHKNARRPDSPVERVSHGSYRMSPTCGPTLDRGQAVVRTSSG
jgi:hypothetical protein